MRMVLIGKKFIKSSLIYTVSGMLPMASAILLLPFYISGLSTSDYGILSLYLSFSLLVQILVTFSFDSSLYLHYQEFKNNRKKLDIFVSSAFFFVLILGSIITLFFIIVGPYIFDIFSKGVNKNNISFYPYGLLSVGTAIFQSVIKMYSNLLQSREMPTEYLWFNLITFILIAALTIGGLEVFPSTLAGPVGGRFLALSIMGTLALFKIFTEFGVNADFHFLRSTFNFNISGLLYQVLQWSINYLDRFVMVLFLPIATIGVYDFAIKCLLIFEFIMNGLNSSFYPKVLSSVLGQDTKGSTVEINRYYNGLTAITMLMICGAVLLFPLAMDWFVTKPSYKEALHFIPFISILYFFKPLRLYFAMPYTAIKYTQPLPLYYLLVSILKIGIMLLLVNSIMVYGVIVASGIAMFFEILLLYMGIRKRFAVKINYFKLIWIPSILAVVVLVFSYIYSGRNVGIVNVGYIFLCLALLATAYRNELKLQLK